MFPEGCCGLLEGPEATATCPRIPTFKMCFRPQIPCGAVSRVSKGLTPIEGTFQMATLIEKAIAYRIHRFGKNLTALPRSALNPGP